MDNFTAGNLSFTNSCPNDVVCLLEVVVVIAVTCLTLVFNGGSLLILMSTPSFRNGHGYLLISLSVADLLVGCVAVLSIYPSATLRGMADSWPYGDTVCLIATYIGQVALSNSGYNLAILGIERYIAVAHPLKYARLVTKKTTMVVIALGWLISLSVLSTIFVGISQHMYVPEIYSCLPMITNKSAGLYAAILIFLVVLLLLIIILVTSVMVRRKLKENARRRAAMAPTITPSSASQESNSSRGTSPKSIKLFRMVRIMTLAVFLSRVPFLSFIVITVLSDIRVAQVIAFTTHWLLISNSFVNSIIYYVMNTQFRNRVHEMADTLAPKCCREISEFDRSLVCACCTWKRPSRAYQTTSGDNSHIKTHQSQHHSQGNRNVEPVTVKKERVRGVDNRGFRNGESSLTLQPREQSQAQTIHQ